MATSFDISLVKGEPFTTTITAGVCTTGQFNFSGYAITGGIKYHYTSGNIANFDIFRNSDPSGIITISLTSGQTSNLPITECLYYLKAYPSGGGTFIDLLDGYARIYPL